VPGLELRDLLSLDVLDRRLTGDPARWRRAREATEGIGRDVDWRGVLVALGYQLERRGRRGWLARHAGRPVAVVHRLGDPAEFDRLDQDGRSPVGVLLHHCASAGVPFGLLVCRRRLRLFHADPATGAASARHLDLDAGALPDHQRPYLALLGPEYLAGGQLAALQREAREAAAALRRRLDGTIRQTVLPALGRALGRLARSRGLDPADERLREELEQAALKLVFRALFQRCAEGSGAAWDGVVEPDGDDAAARGGPQAGTGGPQAGTSGPKAGAGSPKASAGGLRKALLADPEVAAVLLGLGRDPAALEAVDLGHLYEGLRSLRLAAGDAGELRWQAHEGDRKGGGVYYTRPELVRHLVGQTVVPAFRAHLERIGKLAATDQQAAAAGLLDFAVLDPACGGAGFLVAAVDQLTDELVRFLGRTPLPPLRAALHRLRATAGGDVEAGDLALLRLLVLERCVFGVDVSPMGAAVAALSLRLATLVPGLPPADLGRNLVVGDALVGVLRPEAMRPPGDRGQGWPLQHELDAALARAADGDAPPTAAALGRLFDLWTAEPFGLAGARREVELHGAEVLQGRSNGLAAQAAALGRRHRFLHWPLAFPGVFARRRPGFDAVVGNPPWEQVMVKSVGFYLLHRPRLAGLPEADREAAITALLGERPDLEGDLRREQDRTRAQRAYFARGEYTAMPGHPDLYKFFAQRYRALLREGGALGVVLPRSAFTAAGAAGFRRWLFEETTCRRVDFLQNSGRWAFDAEPRYTVALVGAERTRPGRDHRVRVAGPAVSPAQWERQAAEAGIGLAREAFGPGWTVPLLAGQAEAELLAKLRRGAAFPHGPGGRWRCFAVQELNETADRSLWRQDGDGWPLWKGESFEQYQPHGAQARTCPTGEALWARVRKRRPGDGSLVAAELGVAARRQAVLAELGRARVAFRDVSRASDSRTVRACLVPPRVLLTNTAPYLAFAAGDQHARAACLGIMNSLPFDWQARRFVELHLNFFILEGLVVPDLDERALAVVASSAARLSCVDERFSELAAAVGVEVGPLAEDQRARLRVEIDAQVARAWSLTAEDLEVLLADFTPQAVPPAYRRRLAERLAELSSAATGGSSPPGIPDPPARMSDSSKPTGRSSCS
jgi:hypothetical protein